MATPWQVPRMWEGMTVVAMATGPSLTRQQANLVAVADLPVIAVNDNGIDVERDGEVVPAMAPQAAILYASDADWWRTNSQAALKFPGLKVTCMDSCEFKSVKLLKQTGMVGFDPNPKHIRTGGNSGYAALHIAIQAGARRVLLLGYDMGNSAGHHWFGKHQRGLRTTDTGSFARWVDRFPALSGQGAEIINCSPGSALKCFPTANLVEALA